MEGIIRSSLPAAAFLVLAALPVRAAQFLEIIPHTIKSYPSGAAVGTVRDYLRSGMSTRLDKWSDGDAPLTVLEECLLLANASEAAFPNDAPQADLRMQAAASKKWIDRRLAILRTLYAGKQFDAFLAAYRDFEPYDKSFADLSAARRASLNASAFAHLDAARRQRVEGDYASAIRNLRLAQLRNPELAQAGELLEEVRLEIARLSALKTAELRRGIDPRSPAQVQVQRKLLLAEQYLSDGKLAEAEQSLKDAEAMDKDEPKIRFTQARLSMARGDYGMALALLDLYAGMALTPQDFAEGEKLRAGVQYKIDNARTETRAQLKTLYSEQHFATALQTAATGLKLDNEEPAYLLQAGVNACLLRHCADAAPLLHRYLDLTDGTQPNREQRLSAIRLLRQANRADLQAASNPSARAAALSWFSGVPLERGVFYDPMSLAFQPRAWRRGRHGGLAGLGTLRQSFAPQNYSIHADPQGGSTSRFLTLWNSPRLDPRLAYMVTGKRAAIGFSGNHYFHPFVWDAIHLFELDYDDQGRIRHAWERDEPNAPRLDFAWDGNRLVSVIGKTTPGETVVYSRTLNYSGELKLTSESITQAGKTSHIQYKYNKQGVLLEAECDSDPSLDGRSRKIEFFDETADKGKHDVQT